MGQFILGGGWEGRGGGVGGDKRRKKTQIVKFRVAMHVHAPTKGQIPL